jgi:hypothetical protein
MKLKDILPESNVVYRYLTNNPNKKSFGGDKGGVDYVIIPIDEKPNNISYYREIDNNCENEELCIVKSVVKPLAIKIAIDKKSDFAKIVKAQKVFDGSLKNNNPEVIEFRNTLGEMMPSFFEECCENGRIKFEDVCPEIDKTIDHSKFKVVFSCFLDSCLIQDVTDDYVAVTVSSKEFFKEVVCYLL